MPWYCIGIPTPAPEAVYISYAIDAKDSRTIVTIDIPGMFMQTKAKPESSYLVLCGEMLKELLKVAPEFEFDEFVETVSTGKRVLYSTVNVTTMHLCM